MYGNIDLKKFEMCEDAALPDFLINISHEGKEMIVRKNSFLWILHQKHLKISSDRLQRFVGKNMQPSNSIKNVVKMEKIEIGDFCVFICPENGQIYLEHCLGFQYETKKSKEVKYFKQNSCPVTPPENSAKRGIIVLSNRYEVDGNGFITLMRINKINITHYQCHVRTFLEMDKIKLDMNALNDFFPE